MKITFWGARGSIPVSGPQYDKYGGNTACLDIRTNDGKLVIIDAGTGIRELGNLMAVEGPSACHLFCTHAHWDHIMGFPFFKPIYKKGTRILICGCTTAQDTVKGLLSRTMAHPFFPIDFDAVKQQIEYDGVCRLSMEIGGLEVRNITLNHPQNGLGFKFTEGGKVFVFLTDNEISHKHPGGREYEDYVRFAEGADLLVHDAQYTEKEYAHTKGWGHSLYGDAVRLALDAGVKRLGLFHHDAERSDAALDRIVEDCQETIASKGGKAGCFAVEQGMKIEL